MAIKMREMSALEKCFLVGLGFNESFEEAKAKEDPKSVEFFPASTGWMSLSRTGIMGNEITIVEPVKECKLVEEVKPGIEMTITNKIPISLFKEIIGSFNRIYKKWGTECAAQIYQKRDTKEFFIYYPKQKVTGAHVNYAIDTNLNHMATEYSLVMEIHSHDSMGAFWSGEDNRNENSLCYYMVIGNFSAKQCTYKLRCKYKTYTIDLSIKDLFDIGDESEESLLATATLGLGSEDIEAVCEKETYAAGAYTGVGYGTRYLYSYGGKSKTKYSEDVDWSSDEDWYRNFYGGDGYVSSNTPNKEEDELTISNYMKEHPYIEHIYYGNPIYDCLQRVSKWDRDAQCLKYKNFVRNHSKFGGFVWELEYDEDPAGKSCLVDDDVNMLTEDEIDSVIGKVTDLIEASNITSVSAEHLLDVLEDADLELLAECYDISIADVEAAIKQKRDISILGVRNIMNVLLTEGNSIVISAYDEFSDIL